MSLAFTDLNGFNEEASSPKMIALPCYKLVDLIPKSAPNKFDLIIIPDIDAMIHFKKSCWSNSAHCTNVLTFESKTYSFSQKRGDFLRFIWQKKRARQNKVYHELIFAQRAPIMKEFSPQNEAKNSMASLTIKAKT